MFNKVERVGRKQAMAYLKVLSQSRGKGKVVPVFN
jgi:hypothetical protein